MRSVAQQKLIIELEIKEISEIDVQYRPCRSETVERRGWGREIASKLLLEDETRTRLADADRLVEKLHVEACLISSCSVSLHQRRWEHISRLRRTRVSLALPCPALLPCGARHGYDEDILFCFY